MSPTLLSAAALVAAVGIALLLGKWLAQDERAGPVLVSILGAVGIAVVYYALDVLVDIDNLEFGPLLILIQFASLPVIAGYLARIMSGERGGRRTIVAAVVPVVFLVLLLNPFSELWLACTFGHSIYMTQFFGFAGC